MPSTYSPDLRIELIANGEQSGLWGTTTNTNLGTLIEDAISGLALVAITSANQALTAASGAVDEARCSAVSLSLGAWGSPANFNLYVPPVTKLYVIQNSTGYTATVCCSTALNGTTATGGSTVAVPTGKTVLLRAENSSGTFGIVEQLNYVVGPLGVGGALSVTGAATFGSTVTLNADPTLALQAATKQYVDTAAGASFPVGGIIMWSGTVATIPSGWALCDGTSGTPDLRNRFIIGAHSDDAGVAKTTITGSPTQTGGSKDAIVVSHTHSVTDPGHTHNIQGSGHQNGSVGYSKLSQFTTTNTGILSSTTGISIDSAGSSGTNANLVPYYALAFIMKL